MAASTAITCCSIRPPAPPKQPAAHPPHHRLRRACVAAAACAVIAAAGGGTAAATALEMGGSAHDVVHAQAVAQWGDHRQCPPWSANTLENVVPENLPRPSARRRFNSVTAAERALAPPDAVVPFLALRSGMGCFSL